MNREEFVRILHGQVYYAGRWMTIERKIELETKRHEKVEQGLVHFQGEWIPIEDKLHRTSTREVPIQQPSQNIVYNQTVNRQVYMQNNVDNRTTEEHRHVHVDPQNLQSQNGQVPRIGADPGHILPGQAAEQLPTPREHLRLPEDEGESQ